MENKSAYTSIISVRADKEIKSSFNWYEGQQQGLGSRFIDDVIATIDKIVRNPEIASIKYKSYRETSVDIFPYLIIYRLNKRKYIVRIVSVFHTSQNPNKKYK